MWCWEFHEVGLGNGMSWGLRLGYFTCLFLIGFYDFIAAKPHRASLCRFPVHT